MLASEVESLSDSQPDSAALALAEKPGPSEPARHAECFARHHEPVSELFEPVRLSTLSLNAVALDAVPHFQRLFCVDLASEARQQISLEVAEPRFGGAE